MQHCNMPTNKDTSLTPGLNCNKNLHSGFLLWSATANPTVVDDAVMSPVARDHTQHVLCCFLAPLHRKRWPFQPLLTVIVVYVVQISCSQKPFILLADLWIRPSNKVCEQSKTIFIPDSLPNSKPYRLHRQESRVTNQELWDSIGCGFIKWFKDNVSCNNSGYDLTLKLMDRNDRKLLSLAHKQTLFLA